MAAEVVDPRSAESYGEVFTHRWVVEVLLDLAGYEPRFSLSELRLVEPSCGSGAFLLPAIERLLRSAGRMRLDRRALAKAIVAWDIQAENVQACRVKVQNLLVDRGYSSTDAKWLAARWVQHGDYLLTDVDVRQKADFVVGNPPYVRLEDVSPQEQAQYRAQWRTMGGRADLYIGFFEKGLRSLKPGGKLAFICADRWMRNQYGASLRSMVTKSYSVDAVWTMHDVDAFESAVAAYPAIVVMSHGEQKSAVVADTDATFDMASAKKLASWASSSDLHATSGRGYNAYRLPHWFPGDEMWPSGSPERLALIERLTDEFEPLHQPDSGTRVGIGVATGADGVFITREPSGVETERLLKLAMVADNRTGHFKWGGQYLVNPWAPDGKLVDLEKFPGMASYFKKHKEQLGKRYIAQSAKKPWYQTIDKVNHALISQPKLLIQDLRTSINPVLDPGGHYPHHNLYYITSTKWDMEVLGGLLLSEVAQAFVEAYCVRMRGNTLRFQAQYLKKIRIPKPEDVAASVRKDLKAAFRARDTAAATKAALLAYGLE